MFRSPHKSTSQVRLSTVVLQAVAAKAVIVAAVAALAAAAALHSAQGTRRASASGSLPPPAQPPSDAPALSPAHAATSRWARNHIDNLEQCCGCQVLNWRATSSSPVRYGHGPVTKRNRAPVRPRSGSACVAPSWAPTKTRPSQQAKHPTPFGTSHLSSVDRQQHTHTRRSSFLVAQHSTLSLHTDSLTHADCAMRPLLYCSA
jgi:type IV secretory pathway VirB10-like protein